MRSSNVEIDSADRGLEWRRRFEETCLEDRLEVLRKDITSCLKNDAAQTCSINNDPVLAIALKENLDENNVIKAIEWFLYGEDPTQGWSKLSKLNSPPTLCGKVFKNNELTYSCRDCAYDATCVLCMACFEKSIHKGHNHRLNASTGGGCCDCGDEEAWKQGASCEFHSAKSAGSADEDLLKKLPEDLLCRAECLFTILLDFCVQMICDPVNEEALSGLPAIPDDKNSHVTMLYNDESHTFHGVISALTKSIPGCTEKLGNDFATVVDREGRSSIFVGPLQKCDEVCVAVKENTKSIAGPLKCEVSHIYSIAFQLMALKLMKWLSDLCNKSDCLRRLQSNVCTRSNHGQHSHLSRVFQADGKLWKTARVHNHQLFMNMLLKDSKGKVTLAIEFTKNYATLVNDYFADDQEHSISAVSMSVQLFTVPSLALMLITDCDLLDIVMKVILEKTESFVGENGVMDFNKDERNKSKRLYWMMHDLRYIVQHKPNKWSDTLKEKFYGFLKLFFQMLGRFEGLGKMNRATGSHIEIEPEWHRDFHFEMRLIALVPFILQWCESDKDVLLKSIDITLKEIKSKKSETKLKKHHENKKSMKIFEFDLSSDKVSMHIPIIRFLAGLIGCCRKYSIDIRDVLNIRKDEDVLMYLEHPLKVLGFVAQVKSGMWKRNGYSVLHQVYAYRKGNAATDMYDNDIFFMQALASCMADKDYFLHLVLEMFKLVPWTSSKYNVDKKDESTVNQQLSLAEEFLHLIIIIIGERYKTVVGQADEDSELKREIIHRLCLGDMSRSELLRGLPLSDSEYERQENVDEIINSVATFKKPGLSSKGMYKIKKEFLSDFNPFFYHYYTNEQSTAEHSQRKRCKEEEIPSVFIPPVPVEFLPMYSSIVNLLTTKKMIDLLSVLLWRIQHANPKSWTDRIFHEVLHLIGLALHEEAQQKEKGKSFGFIDAATKNNSNVPEHPSLFKCLELLQGNQNIKVHTALLSWVIQKFNEEQSALQGGSDKPSVECSPSMDIAESSPKDEEKMHRQRLASERKQKILLQMAIMQKAFIEENSELYSSTKTDLEDSPLDETDLAEAPHSEQAVIVIGNDRTPPVTIPRKEERCILCQQNPGSNERPLVYCAYVQRSTLLSSNHSETLEEGEKADPLVSYRDQRQGTHVGSCGHVMHGDCWRKYFESKFANNRLSLRFRMQNTFDLSKREFSCPLCSGLGNTVLPMLYPTDTAENESSKSSYTSWFIIFRKIESKLTNSFKEIGRKSEPGEGIFRNLRKLTATFLPMFYGGDLSSDMKAMISIFTRDVYTSGLNVDPFDEDSRVSLMVWTTCAYTIQCFEHSSREESSGLVKRGTDILKSLIFLANSVSSVSKSHDILNHCLRLISVLTETDKLPAVKFRMMDVDLFDWMVKMRFSLPCIDCPEDSSQSVVEDCLSAVELDGFVFHLALAANIVQILLTTSENFSSDTMDDYNELTVDAASKIANLWKTLRYICYPATQTSTHPNPQRLLLHLKYRLLPFLRCSAIFLHILNSSRTPLALRGNFPSLDKEYDALAKFLAIPQNLTELFGWNDSESSFTDETVSKIVRRWCTNVNIVDSSKNIPNPTLMQKSLIKLPRDYSELICEASQYDCPLFSGDENRVPAKCLVCGKWLCCEAWCCKQTIGDQTVGSCTAHALTCGAGTGIFLRVRDCIVLLLNGIGKGCFYPSPYLDAYGETDPGLRRGNPLYLCEERYQRLQKLWKQHGIASEIVRHLETNRTFLQVDWNNY